jgi:hypothetical protein
MNRTNWISPKRLLVTASLALFLALPIAALAETTEEPATETRPSGLSIINPCATGSDLPQLDCVLLTLGNIAQIILALTGSLALLMFVYGGFTMLTSGGSSDKVNQGKKILLSAVTGIVIVLLAGYLIRYGMQQLGVQEEFTNVPQTTNTEETTTPATP